MKNRCNRGLSFLLSLLLIASACYMEQFHVLAEEIELAQGKTAVATHYQEGNGIASYALDGSFATKWSTYGHNNVVPVALQVDLGMQCDVSRLGMSWYGSGRIFNYEVYLTDGAIVSGEAAATEGISPILAGQGQGAAQQAETCEYTKLEQTATGRYVTLVVTSLEGTAAFVALAEFEVWGVESLPDNLTELAYSKVVTATFSEGISPAENAVDGDVATRWSSYGSEMPQALMIDMDAVVSIGYLNLLIFQNNRTTEFEIYLTEEPPVTGDQLDLGDAEPIGTISGQGVGDGKTRPESWDGMTVCRTDSSVTGRYLTIVGVAATSGTAAGLWEVEAYGEVQGPVIREVLSVSALTSVTVEVGASEVESLLPQTVRVNLEKGRSALLPVSWNLTQVRLDNAGDYTVQGVLDCSGREDISNSSDIMAQLTIHVRDPRQEAIDAVQSLISAIGEVTQDHYEDKRTSIEAAEQALAKLINEFGEAAASEVENREILQTARTCYDDLVKRNAVLYGDVNSDTRIDASDALLALQSSVSLIVLDDSQKAAGDVDGNQIIDASDALLILQKSVNLITIFPVEAEK